MTETKKRPPPDEYSDFKTLLGKIAKVPKVEADEKEAEWQRERKKIKRTG